MTQRQRLVGTVAGTLIAVAGLVFAVLAVVAWARRGSS